MATEFIETRLFSRAADRLLSQEDRESITEALAENPLAGAVIPRTGGLRKVRIAGSGRGKRGGYRVIYAITKEGAVIYLLLIYAKNEMDDLTAAQYKQLSALTRD